MPCGSQSCLQAFNPGHNRNQQVIGACNNLAFTIQRYGSSSLLFISIYSTIILETVKETHLWLLWCIMSQCHSHNCRTLPSSPGSYYVCMNSEWPATRVLVGRSCTTTCLMIKGEVTYHLIKPCTPYMCRLYAQITNYYDHVQDTQLSL